MDSDSRNIVSEIRKALLGKKCWYVSCGGRVGATFELALGNKVARDYVIANTAHSEEFRHYEGEANLLIWCTWRLDDLNRPLTSSDDANDELCKGLETLVGASIIVVEIDLPGWDLTLQFSRGLRLRIFCDHVGRNPSFDGNWEVIEQDRCTYIGAGSVCEIEPRERLKPVS